MAKPGSGLLLDPQQTALTMNQRIMFNRLVAQGTPAAVARQVAIAVAKSEGLTPPSGVQSACKRGLELAPEYGGQGLTDGAKARARSMAAGNSVSPDQVRRMAAFFGRHSVDKKPGWSSPPTPGYVAWMLWGGDAGASWAKSQSEKIEKSERRQSVARACAQARVQARKADSERPGYHKAFAEAAKAILPVSVTAALHRRARAVAGGHGKAAAVAYVQAQDMGLPVAKGEWNEADHPRADDGKFDGGAGGSSSPHEAEAAAHQSASEKHYAEAADHKKAGNHEAYMQSMRAGIASARAGNAAMAKHIESIKQGTATLRQQAAEAKERAAAAPPPKAESPTPRAPAAVAAERPLPKEKPTVEPKGTDRHSIAFVRQSGAQHAREMKLSQAKADKYRNAGKEALADKHQQNADAHRYALHEMKTDKTGISAERGKKLFEGAQRSYSGSNGGRGGREGIEDYFRSLSPAERDFVASVDSRVGRQERAQKSEQKPLGAAFSHARATGEKQDEKSRKRRANEYLREKGHEGVPIEKTAPDVADVRQEEWADVKPKRKRRDDEDREAAAKADRVAVSMSTRIVKAEDVGWKKLVWSVVYEPDVEDTHGDYMDAETIEKAAHGAMRNGIYINREHAGAPVGAHVVESYVAPCEMRIGPPGEEVTVAKGSWVMGMQIETEDLWAEVLNGTFTGFSLEGSAAVPAAA